MTSLMKRRAMAACFSMALLAGLAAANAAKADDAALTDCRDEGQASQVMTDCDQHVVQKYKVPPEQPNDPVTVILAVEGGKGDHDRDRGANKAGGRGGAVGANGRP
ncbi:MAG TPA: hypothetical protein VH835_07330 [Dongiaceae bacterium]